MKYRSLLLSFLAIGILSANRPYYKYSQVTYPQNGSELTTFNPVISGLVLDKHQAGVSNEWVIIRLDGKEIAQVKTDDNGVFSYLIKQYLPLGAHVIDAVAPQWSTSVLGTQFHVNNAIQNTQALQSTTRAGDVDTFKSLITSPNRSHINTPTPIIAGLLLNSSNNPVAGETVQVKIDGTIVDTVTSNSNGVFSHQVENDLSDGLSYVIGAHCVQTNVDLNTFEVVIDLTNPDAPTITAPLQNQVINSADVQVEGLTESDLEVTINLDNQIVETTTADAGGHWNFLFENLNDGLHFVQAKAEDFATNESDYSDPVDFEINLF